MKTVMHVYLLCLFSFVISGSLFAAARDIKGAMVDFKVQVKGLAASGAYSSKEICEQAEKALGEKYSPEIPERLLLEAVAPEVSYTFRSSFDRARAKDPKASSYNDVNLVRILLEGGAVKDVDKPYESGFGTSPKTALYLAAMLDLREIVQLLVDHGADPQKEFDGKTCVQKARSQLVRDILEGRVRYEPAPSRCSWLNNCAIQ